jgi:hypothetical protein
VMGDFFQNCDAHVSDDGKKITFRERQETHPMTTPTTPITASVGEPTPIPERPTLYMSVWWNGSEWRGLGPETNEHSARHDVPTSVLVTIPGTRDASYTAELDNYDGLASEEASHSCVWCGHELSHNMSDISYFSVPFIHPDQPGKMQYHCMRCVIERVFSPTAPREHATHDRLFFERVSKVLDELVPGWMDDVEVSNHDLVEQAIRSLVTAPRAEGGPSSQQIRQAIARAWCHTENERKVMDPDIVIAATTEVCALLYTPPRDRCEVCGGTGTVLGLTSDLAVRHDPCPRCTKETPCDSVSGSSVSSEGTSSMKDTTPGSTSTIARESDTSWPTSATGATSNSAKTATAASDPATVAEEGPYRVERSKQAVGWWEVEPLTTYDGSTIFKEHMDAIDAARIANHAHRTALAVREGEVVRLRKALEPFAKFAGSKFAGTVWEDRPSSPVLFHSFTGSSVTANDFYAARDALQGAAR